MANRWGNNGNSDRLDSKSLWMVTAAMKLKDTCSLEEKLWPTNRQHIQKQRHYFANKVCLVKAMVFPVVMYGCESWTIKKAEHWRIDAFELWCWRRLLRVPWTARRPNQSILKEISPRCSFEGLMLKLKVQYFGHLMRRIDSVLRLWYWDWGQKGTTEDKMAGWHHRVDGHEFGWTPGVGGQVGLACCNSRGHDWATELTA